MLQLINDKQQSNMTVVFKKNKNNNPKQTVSPPDSVDVLVDGVEIMTFTDDIIIHLSLYFWMNENLQLLLKLEKSRRAQKKKRSFV